MGARNGKGNRCLNHHLFRLTTVVCAANQRIHKTTYPFCNLANRARIFPGYISCNDGYMPFRTQFLRGPIADYGDCNYWVTLPSTSYDTLLRSECHRGYGEVVDHVQNPETAYCVTDQETQTVTVQVDICCTGEFLILQYAQISQ